MASQPEPEKLENGAPPAAEDKKQPAEGIPPEDLEEDPEKKRKKEEKLREKEAKKAKAAAKAAAAAAKAAEGPSKKSEQKAKKAALASTPGGGGGDAESSEDPPTVLGEKKNLAPDMAKAYNPRAVEASWYEWWEKSGYFSADPESTKPPFTIVVPPPNVTGALHIGHALTDSIEDLIVRWRRMSGYNVCWVPGVDHAGIATQVVVEKKLMREQGLSRHDVGREPFVQLVWKYREEYGNKILHQMRKLGGSLDWSKECFTMDEPRSKAVTEAFVRLHSEGLIYRDNRLVNWDCVLRTAISDIEVEYEDVKGRTLLPVPGYDAPVEFGAITSFAYPLEDGSGEIVVATTRPETMLGDTAVAVHPEDARYAALHGKRVVHPFSGRTFPIICDAELVDMAFGTGAVKITPAHDPNDFATGKRHALEFINVLTDDGLINGNGGAAFEGMKRFDARTKVIELLQEKGLYRGVADNPMRLGFCSRSKDVIEPMIKPQWYVNCNGAAAEACAAVRDGRLEVIPRSHEDTWFRWLENIRDWCISRQLWWGHRIPAWYVAVEGDAVKEIGAYNDRWIVARSEFDAHAAAEAKFGGEGKAAFTLHQDPDVLDTWFSSGLFPFSVFGWPDQTPELEAFYPTALLETGHDILFFWVARMVMMGLLLTKQVPFKQVYLHAMVRDAHGRKMSKSLGNVIDPLEVIYGVTLQQLQEKLEGGNLDPREVEKAKRGQQEDFPQGIAECGCDALRFALINYTAQSVNINLDIQRVVGYRTWCNKLWNAIRFALINLGPAFQPSPAAPSAARPLLPASFPFACRWILSTLTTAVRRTNEALESYGCADASNEIYAWWQYSLCDVFIELIKPAMSGDDADPAAAALKRATRETLHACLDAGLRLLHPFMPFVTEELWQRLPRAAPLPPTEDDAAAPPSPPPPSIMLAPYPTFVKEWENQEVEAQMRQVEAAVRATRKLRGDYGLLNKQRPELYLQCRTDAAAECLRNRPAEICTLALVSKVEVLRESEVAPLGCAVAIVDENVTAHLLLRGVVDPKAELAKLEKKAEDNLRSKEALAKKTKAPGYAEKVPAAIQEEYAAKQQKLDAELDSIHEVTANFEKLLSLEDSSK